MSNLELRQDETIIKEAKGDCWKTPEMFSKNQTPGRYTFTNQRIIFLGNGIIEKLRIKFELPYSEIDSVKPYLVFLFPTGIKIKTKNGDCYKLSLMKRQQYMDIINTYCK